MINTSSANRVCVFVALNLLALCSGCDPVTEIRNQRPSDCPWLVGAAEYPDLSRAERIDIALSQTRDSNADWIKAQMHHSYDVATLEKDIQRLRNGDYKYFRMAVQRNLDPDYSGGVIGSPRNWPKKSSTDPPKWWSPPSNCPDGVVFILDRQVTLEAPGQANRAHGLYVLFSPKSHMLWIWRWNQQHVKLSESRTKTQPTGKSQAGTP